MTKEELTQWHERRQKIIKGWTQTNSANAFGVTLNAFQKWLDGTNPIPKSVEIIITLMP